MTHCPIQDFLHLEFFGKFYEGGGKAFEPFKENTKYVDVKEETTL